MSVDTYVFLRKDELPTPEAWQAEISAHGFELELDTGFDPETFTGFVPCRYRGGEGGFDYVFAPLELGMLDEAARAVVGLRECVVTLVTRSSLADLACATIASAALCALCGGVWSDGDDFVPAPAIIHKARLDLDAIHTHLPR